MPRSGERISDELESSGSVEGLDDVVQYSSSCTMTELSVNDLTMAFTLYEFIVQTGTVVSCYIYCPMHVNEKTLPVLLWDKESSDPEGH